MAYVRCALCVVRCALCVVRDFVKYVEHVKLLCAVFTKNKILAHILAKKMVYCSGSTEKMQERFEGRQKNPGPEFRAQRLLVDTQIFGEPEYSIELRLFP